MAAAVVKKPCNKCDKGSGVTTCDGCQQSFCIKHVIEHRQELATHLEDIGQEHDLLRRDLTQDNAVHPLLTYIDEWEQESITKIQVAAEAARADLRLLLDQEKTGLKTVVDKMTNEMQSCRELDDYTEIDLHRWAEELKEFRQLLQRQITAEIVEDENRSTAIQMIRIREQQPAYRAEKPAENQNYAGAGTMEVNHERFRNFIGRIALSEDGLSATCLGAYWDGSNVYGNRLYSSGRHEVNFRIENKGGHNLFFGIKTTSHDMTVQTLASPHAYGWWELDQAIESVNGHRVHNDRNIRTGDVVTMIIDCDERQIRFEHHRINMITHLHVDPQKCALPWKIVVTLRSPGDSIRILL
jgi:hypothetical protein